MTDTRFIVDGARVINIAAIASATPIYDRCSNLERYALTLVNGDAVTVNATPYLLEVFGVSPTYLGRAR